MTAPATVPGTARTAPATAPAATAPGTAAPATARATTPATVPAAAPATVVPRTAARDPDDGGEITYPGVGPFEITSLSPARVDVAGGTLVTITGNALPLNPAVRIGDAAAATVVRSSATELVFRAPARVAGSYDVHVFALDDREWTLADALTYVADAAGGGRTG